MRGLHDTDAIHYAVGTVTEDPVRGPVKTFHFGNMRSGCIEAQNIVLNIYRNDTADISCTARTNNVNDARQLEFGTRFDHHAIPYYVPSEHVMKHSGKEYEHVIHFNLCEVQQAHVRTARLHLYPFDEHTTGHSAGNVTRSHGSGFLQ